VAGTGTGRYWNRAGTGTGRYWNRAGTGTGRYWNRASGSNTMSHINMSDHV